MCQVFEKAFGSCHNHQERQRIIRHAQDTVRYNKPVGMILPVTRTANDICNDLKTGLCGIFNLYAQHHTPMEAMDSIIPAIGCFRLLHLRNLQEVSTPHEHS